MAVPSAASIEVPVQEMPLPWSATTVEAGIADTNASEVQAEVVDNLLKHLSIHDGDTVGCCAQHPSLRFEQLPSSGFSLYFYASLVQRQAEISKVKRRRGDTIFQLFSRRMGPLIDDFGSVCPAAYALHNLYEAERILFRVLPVASADAPWTTWKSQIDEAEFRIKVAKGYEDLYQKMFETGRHFEQMYKKTVVDEKTISDLPKCCSHHRAVAQVVDSFARHVRRLQGLLSLAFKEPWLSSRMKLRTWLSDSFVLDRFQLLGRPSSVSVGDTSPYLNEYLQQLHQESFDNNTSGLGGSAAAQRQAYQQVWRVLSEIRRGVAHELAGGHDGSIGGPFEGLSWPIKGTQLLMLRHGSWHGNLAHGKIDIVDRDMDFAILMGSPSTWFRIAHWLTQRLLSEEWLGCQHTIIGWYERGKGPAGTAWNPTRLPGGNASVMLDGRGPSLLTCTRVVGDAWVQFELVYNSVMELSVTTDRADAQNHASPVRTPLCTGSEPSAADGCESDSPGAEVLGQSLEGPWRIGKLLAQWSLSSHDGHLKNLVIVSNPVCEVGESLTGRCFAGRAYPYQCWTSGLPASCVLLSMRRCAAYNLSLPCPKHATDMLKYFNSGKYWARLPGRPCLALPLLVKRANTDGTLQNGYADRQGYDERNHRLEDEGITEADVQVLKRTSASLRARGFLAFASGDYAECTKTASGSYSATVTVNYKSI